MRVLIIRTRSISVAWSEDQMTEVRWFLSIQFSKSLIPWRAYQSRALGTLCQALFGALTGARCPSPTTWGAQQYGSCELLSTPCGKFFRGRPLTSEDSTHDTRKSPCIKGGKRKDGGRVPRQGRHVLDGTLDRMEGASLRGPETLPPWNLVFKWSDTSWYHSLGPGSFSTLHFDDATSNALTQSLN